VNRLEIASAKSDIACLQHAMFVGVSRLGLACERECQLKSSKMARMKSSTYAQDRLRFSEALRLGDNSHRNRAAVIHRLPQHRLGVGPLLDRRPWAHEHRWTATRPRPPSEAIGGQA
jgi:hypothetical protein